jgi:hypothetical protein
VNSKKYFAQSTVPSSPQNYLTNYCSNPSPHPKFIERFNDNDWNEKETNENLLKL